MSWWLGLVAAMGQKISDWGIEKLSTISTNCIAVRDVYHSHSCRVSDWFCHQAAALVPGHVLGLPVGDRLGCCLVSSSTASRRVRDNC